MFAVHEKLSFFAAPTKLVFISAVTELSARPSLVLMASQMATSAAAMDDCRFHRGEHVVIDIERGAHA